MVKDIMNGIEIVDIELTNACNAKCTFCPREKMTRPIGFMNTELFKKLVDECAKENIREINLTGYGETFLDKKVIEKIRYIKSRYNPILTVTTNCSLLTPELNKHLISSGLDEIKASIYSMDPIEYNKDQQLDLYKILNNLKDLKEQKKKNNTKLPYVVTCFMKGWRDKNIPDYKEKIKDYVDEIKPDMNLHNFIYGKNYQEFIKTNLRIPCERPTKTAIVKWDGDIIPCPFDFNNVMVMGNVTKSTIREAVNSEKYKDFCDKLARRRYNELPYCAICDEVLPYTLGNRLKRFYYLHFKRPFQWKERIDFYNKLRHEERRGRFKK